MAILKFRLLIGIMLAVFGSIVFGEEVVIANYQKTAVLVCPVSQNILITLWTGPPGTTIYNYPNSTAIIQSVPNADRLEIDTNARLMIHNVTLEDQGHYKCTAVLVGTAEVHLEVTNVPPTRVNVREVRKHGNSDVVDSYEDASLTMTCTVDGAKPEPNITWSRSGINGTLKSTVSLHQDENGAFSVSASVTIVTTRDLDGAMFICSVNHSSLESPIEKEVGIYLTLMPQMKDTGNVIRTTEGFDTTISCEVFGARPAAYISLYLGGDYLVGFDKNAVVHNQTSDTYSTSVLFHTTLNREDNGKTVTCLVDHVALNSSLNKTWRIIVEYPPSANVYAENVTSLVQTLSMKCYAYSGKPDKFTFSPWQHRLSTQSNILRELDSTNIENNKATLQIKHLTFRDSGLYTCLVSNGIGTNSNPDYKATAEVFVTIKDVPFVVNGHTEYLSSVDETIEIIIDVYTNVKPLHSIIARKMDSTETTAIWTIKKTTEIIVGLPEYGQNIFAPGIRIVADFEVQAEANYGDYKVVIENDVGSTNHFFKVLPKAGNAQINGAKDAKMERAVSVTLAVVDAICILSFM